MNEELCLRSLGDLMAWDDDVAREEYQWLWVASRFKYDRYRDYVAGSRFLEHLLIWLGQFKSVGERAIAYQFVRHRLVYFSPAELNKLIELFYFEVVRPNIVLRVSTELGIKPQLVWANPEAREKYDTLKRQTLFMGLSDGAHMELVRYAANGALSNEQIVGTTQIDVDKWEDVRKELRDELQNPKARFTTVYAIDDFTGSGTSLIRRPAGEPWKGKLFKLLNSIHAAQEALGENIFDENFELRIHHYIASEQARDNIKKQLHHVQKDPPQNGWFPNVQTTYGMPLNSSHKLDETLDKEFLSIADKYYDPAIEEPVRRHLEQSPVNHLRRGYSGCALPLVLDHNTPNNSITLLWESSDGNPGPAMRPLFQRRQRHA